jgi:hypothetical protein
MWSKNYRLQNIQLSKNRRITSDAATEVAISNLFARGVHLCCIAAPGTTFAWLPTVATRFSQALRRLVENTGIEPVTSWLQTRRSPS